MLREVQAVVMDLVVCGREEAKARFSRARPDSMMSEASSNGGEDTPTSNGAPLGVMSPTGPGGSAAAVGVRRIEKHAGNDSVVRIAAYIARVHGIDLGRVGVIDPALRERRESLKGSEEGSADSRVSVAKKATSTDATYGWPELQVGVVREALAIAEALPDHASVAQFSLSTLRSLHEFITPQEQQHLAQAAIRAINISRRRGIFRSMEFWFDGPLVGLDLAP